jgi:membrane-associated protease RseP (regulator of RpoE activity)
MIDLAEKIVAGLCGLIVIATLGGYIFLRGLPSTTSREFIAAIPETSAPPAEAKSAAPEPPPPVTAEDQVIIEKLRSQGLQGLSGTQGIPKKNLEPVPPPLFEFISAEANLLPEMKLLDKRLIQTKNGQTRLKLTNVKEGSILPKLKLEEGDTIELIDGEIYDFRDDKSRDHWNLFRDKVAKLRRGEPLSITITRKGQPMTLVYRLGQ